MFWVLNYGLIEVIIYWIDLGHSYPIAYDLKLKLFISLFGSVTPCNNSMSVQLHIQLLQDWNYLKTAK